MPSGKLEGHGFVGNHQPHGSGFCPLTTLFSPLNQMTSGAKQLWRTTEWLGPTADIVYHVLAGGIPVSPCTCGRGDAAGDVAGVFGGSL